MTQKGKKRDCFAAVIVAVKVDVYSIDTFLQEYLDRLCSSLHEWLVITHHEWLQGLHKLACFHCSAQNTPLALLNKSYVSHEYNS